tara:strand:+ start:47877 stop:48386 length:510 start_codon:yes stop_codon:yes gene_type:complete
MKNFMRYVIDAHNTIHSFSYYLNLLDQNYTLCLKSFINDCSNYCDKKKIKLILVFDGNPPFDWSKDENGMTIIFSGKKKDADTIISNNIDLAKNTILVTNDKGIKKNTVFSGCKYLSPKKFCQLIYPHYHNKSSEIQNSNKIRGLNSQELMWWKKEIKKELKKKNESPK